MKKTLLFIIALSILLLGTTCQFKQAENKDYFVDKKACFLLFNLKTHKFDKIIGEENCRKRLVPCSTFKIPLAIIAFDSRVLTDENVVLKWKGEKSSLPQHLQDHNAKTWIRDSVLWFSQRLTPQIGLSKITHYLDLFLYGNKDFSAGLTTAWIISPNAPMASPALRISAYEQVSFLKNLWEDKLPVSKRAMQLTREITFLETSPKGFKLSGKTGSNNFGKDGNFWLGWFVAHLVDADGKQEYIAVTNFLDLKATPPKSYGGLRAKEITKKILSDLGLF